MAIEIDLEKAFDRVHWDFIEASLIAAGILNILIKVIMNAISLSSMQVLWNGVPTQKFKLARGIRQGCPLSPYLFVLCMEWLGHSQADLKHSGLLKKFLSDFCEISGHKVNARKMNVFFSSGVNVSLRNKIIAQSVLLTIPSYLMQSTIVPKGVCDAIKKLAGQFIWGCSEGKRKMALVKWDDICQSKINGGLSLRRLEDQNKAFMMKIGYNLITKTEALWVQVLRSKYGMRGNMPTSITRSNCSYMWRVVAKVWPLLCSNMIWSIGNGRTVLCWEDIWVPNKGPLKLYALNNNTINSDITVSNMVLPNGDWNLNLFRLWLPEDVVRCILSILPHSAHFGPDLLSWAKTTSGVFSVKSTYYMLKEESWHPKEKAGACFGKGQGRNMLSILFGMYVTLNSDGTANSMSGFSAAGGVIRNSKGDWILGYNWFLGDCSAATAELWGLLDGLLILQKQGHDKAIIRSDDLENVISINDSKSGVPNNSLIKRIQQILALEDNWSLIYVPRETNYAADALAKMTQPNDETLRIYEEPPLKIKEILKEDRFVDSFSLNHSV
ncbi:hypothetical protein J1N35_033912 [Gossypium stocksii]|uniref:Reverse transcriptase domain-containing protein n=1 Tax=Gossypium stocksii TaxID=47602 RepID=A0A9D3UR30_9ROSI|nr:hypothetical protein J1N35_033912 [Gossypium stocksii]